MTFDEQTLIQGIAGEMFEHVVVREEGVEAERPGVLLFPNVLGVKPADIAYARRVAALGHVVLVVDLFGQGKRATRADADPARYMNALRADRALLRDRLNAAHDLMRQCKGVDPARTAAIGFCFGGLCVLDLARSGAGIAGGVSFHGVYDPPPFPNATIGAKLLVCHGWDDPIAPPDATVALARELTAAGCDWQIHAYGATGHAFTDESAAMPDKGLAYSATADRRSFRAMRDFLSDLFD